MADLVVDLRLLEQTAGSLSTLIEEFSNASKIVSSAQGSSVAEPILVTALEDFANDWSVHRQDLLSSMETVYKMATESRKAYIATDDMLAQDLRESR
jgi:hypothetical protein